MASKKKSKEIKHVVGSTVLILRPLPNAVLLMAFNEDDKPQPPMQDVEYAGGTIVKEPNYADEDYKTKLTMWNGMYNARLVRMAIAYGIEKVTDRNGKIKSPTANDLARSRFVFANATGDELYFHWISSIIGDTSKGFLNLVMGQTEVTEDGIKEAEETFQSDN